MRQLNSVDWAIIKELSRDGRMSNTDLADRVGLTPAPCLRRVRRLEEDGIIAGYQAIIDPRAAGRALEVTVAVEMNSTNADVVAEFEQAVTDFEEVIEARKIFGRPDYLLRVVVADVEAFQRFQQERLSQLPAVFRTDSHQTMKLLKGQA